MTLIKSISGIRGTIGGKPNDNLTPLDTVKFAAAYGSWLKQRSPRKNLKVVIGRDARISGKMVQDLVVATLTGLGIDVVDLGLSTTPTVEIAVPMEKADGGIILTASHNPKQWNALKLLNERGEFLNASRGYAVYQKLNNPYFDRLIKRIRARWQTTPINQKETVRTVVRNEKEGIRGVYGMVSDQSPQAHLAQYWAPFMGITVPIFTGAESLARRLDLAVVFARVTRVSRGHYSLEFVPICERGQQTAERQITDAFLRLTEAQIREEPTYYLWTHRRWKHRDKAPSPGADTQGR